MPIMHSIYRESAVIRIDPDICKKCGACAEICPAEVLNEYAGNVRVRDDAPFGCIACGHCMMVCPEGAITVTGRGLSPDDLLPLPDREKKAGADELAALMQSRRSVRRFNDREVAPDLLERVVEMAATAPMGIPPWDIGCVTVCGRDKVQQLASEIIKGYEGFLRMFRTWVLAVMRPFMRRSTYEQFRYFIRPLAEMLVQRRREGQDTLFWDAPALLIFHHSPYTDNVDVAIACTYAMLAAESFGLGTTIIGSAPPILQRNKALLKAYGVPEDNTPAMALILGYPATQFRRTIRRRFAYAGAPVGSREH